MSIREAMIDVGGVARDGKTGWSFRKAGIALLLKYQQWSREGNIVLRLKMRISVNFDIFCLAECVG